MFVNPITGDRQYMYDIPEPDHDIASDVDTGPDLITYIALGPVVNTPITPGPGRQITHHPCIRLLNLGLSSGTGH